MDIEYLRTVKNAKPHPTEIDRVKRTYTVQQKLKHLKGYKAAWEKTTVTQKAYDQHHDFPIGTTPVFRKALVDGNLGEGHDDLLAFFKMLAEFNKHFNKRGNRVCQD